VTDNCARCGGALESPADFCACGGASRPAMRTAPVTAAAERTPLDGATAQRLTEIRMFDPDLQVAIVHRARS